jgi:hypothetical protein
MARSAKAILGAGGRRERLSLTMAADTEQQQQREQQQVESNKTEQRCCYLLGSDQRVVIRLNEQAKPMHSLRLL